MKGFLATVGTILLFLAAVRMDAAGTVHPLLAAGLLIVLSFFASESFAKAKLPKWMGCVAIGMLIGPEGLGLIPPEVFGKIEWLAMLALGWVAFRLGLGSSGAQGRWRKSASAAVLLVGVSFAGTFLALLLGGVPIVFALLLGTIATASAPLVLSSMQDHGERPEHSSEQSLVIATSVLVLLMWIGVVGGIQLAHSRWIPASVWLPGLKLVGATALAVLVSWILRLIRYTGLLGPVFLSACMVALHLLLASEAALFLFAVTLGIVLPKGGECREGQRATGRREAQMAALFLAVFLGTRIQFRFVGTASFPWVIAGIYVAAMVASKLAGIHLARPLLKRMGLRRWDGAAGFLPQLFLPLALIAATQRQLSGALGFERLSEFSNVAYWGVIWGSLIFPVVARVKGKGSAPDWNGEACETPPAQCAPSMEE
ncbi:MAG: cation:proton antiporter [Candidatus Latescibacterota bacterium]